MLVRRLLKKNVICTIMKKHNFEVFYQNPVFVTNLFFFLLFLSKSQEWIIDNELSVT